MNSSKPPHNSTEDLIASLSEEKLEPVKRFCAWKALFFWALTSLFSVLIGVQLLDVPNNYHMRDNKVQFILELVAGLIVIVLSSAIALQASIPGDGKKKIRIAYAGIILWCSVIAYGIFAEWHRLDLKNIGAHIGQKCFSTTVILGAIPGLFLFFLIRKAAPTKLGLAGVLATLSAGLLGSTVVQFGCPANEPGHIMAGHLLPILIMMAVGLFLGRKLLRW